MGSRLPRKRRRVVWLVVAIVLAAGGTGGWLLLRPSSAEPDAEAVTASATVGTQRRTVSATGTVEPARRADLGFAVSGEVTAVVVEEGDTVTAGQVLATVDDELLAAEVDAAESELDAAEARVDDETAAGASDTQLAAAESAVVSARSRLTAAREALEQAELTATIPGTVVAVDLAVGDQAGSTDPQADQPADDGTDGTGATAGVITVVSTNRYLVEASVAGSDVKEVKAGMAAEITPADASEPVEGTVRTVGLVAEADESGAASFPVTVDVTGQRDDIYAGSSATVTIIVEEREGVLTVPTPALHEDGDTTYVDKLVNGEPVRTVVEVGTAYGPDTEIVSGLEEGDEIEITAFNRRPSGADPQDGGVIKMPNGGPDGGTMPEKGK
jgi:multidrug efflux pump subunit AcrA (membrane-fusion protein)